jgi:hypothetical protein
MVTTLLSDRDSCNPKIIISSPFYSILDAETFHPHQQSWWFGSPKLYKSKESLGIPPGILLVKD